MSDQKLVHESQLPLPLLHRGKVRDVYEVNADTLLMIASDRVSALYLGGPVNGVIPAEATSRSQEKSLCRVPWVVLRVTRSRTFLPWAVLATHPFK